ncbi:MAG: cation:proton antiporter, partial [Acetomicrobium sp.]|nr:cation:proton antiporter [Acetomicrobium sp.]
MSVFSFAFLILSLAILAMSGRLIMGPTVPDRVVALDTLNTFVVATMVILGALFDSIVMVDIAIVYAALSF